MKTNKIKSLEEAGIENHKFIDFLLKSWSGTSSILKMKEKKEILFILSEFYKNNWLKKGIEIKTSVKIANYLVEITKKHHGSKKYKFQKVYDFDFLKGLLKNMKEWNSIIEVLKVSESPYDVLKSLKNVTETGIIKSDKDFKLLKKITKSSGHNAPPLFTFGVPVLVKYNIIHNMKDLETVSSPLLDIISLVEYPENVLRDFVIWGEKRIIKQISDVSLLRDVLKKEGTGWDAQKKYYDLIKLIKDGKIRFTLDLERY